MVEFIKSLWIDEAGQGLPEYALLVAAVVVMVVAAVALFTGDVRNLFDEIGNYIDTNNAIETGGEG